jgi:hypothetical protein
MLDFVLHRDVMFVSVRTNSSSPRLRTPTVHRSICTADLRSRRELRYLRYLRRRPNRADTRLLPRLASVTGGL